MMKMQTFTFYLSCCAILAVIDATSSFFQASPFGYNASSTSILTSSGALPRHELSSINSTKTLIAPESLNATLNNNAATINTISSSSCCFVVQDTVDVRYWPDYVTWTTIAFSTVTSLITFATQYVDTTVTGNISTVVRTLSHNATVSFAQNSPEIPNTYNGAPGPSVTQIGLNGSLVTTFGATITFPTQVYVFPKVNIIHAPAVSDKDGRPACATTSTYSATCPAPAPTQSALHITGINSNAERYFSNQSPNQGSEMTPVDPDVVHISFSEPFIYTPPRDQFPSIVINENLGYVPQALIEWMAQDPDYVSQFPGITTCLPGGPSLDFYNHFCNPTPGNFLQINYKEPDLTVSSTVTVARKGCFHPGACPTPATPAATAVAATPKVTLGAERLQQAKASSSTQAQAASSPAGPETPSLVQAPSQPLPAPTDSSENLFVRPPGNVHGANPPPGNPDFQGLGAIIASAVGITPASPPESQDVHLSPGPAPTLSYSISIAPSASAVVINGVTSLLPAGGPEGGLVSGVLPVAVGSQQISRNAASQYVVAGQTLAPGAPAINVQGTEVSLAPSASAIVIAGSTFVLSATSAPAFTVGAEVVTANSASQYVANGQILTPGGPAVTISGTRISLAPSGTQVVVGSSTIGLPPIGKPPYAPPPPLTLGSQTYTANSNSEYTIDGQILTPGGPAVTVSGTRLSLAPSATQVVVGSSTIRLGPPFTPPPLTFGSQTFTANSASDYIIDGQTLIPGAPSITISGTPISLAPAATQVVIGSHTINLAPATTPPPITFNSQTFTANSLSDYIIDGQTLIPGAPAITISNTPISLAPDASAVVIGSSTSILRSNPTTLPSLVIGAQTFNANAAGAYVIGGQTLTPGASGIVVPGSLFTPSPSPSVSVFTVAGQVFTANPTAFSIDGTTISAGGPGVVISGTPVRLLASGVLDVGNSTVTLGSTGATNGNGLGLATFTGEGGRIALRLGYVVLGSVLTLLIVVGV